MSDPEHFKSYYAGEWAKHKADTQELKSDLETRHAYLKDSIKVGFGADTTEYLQMPPTEKAEPSLTLVKDYKDFCCIWISGSDKMTPKGNNNIWVRPDKIENAITKNSEGKKCWFYMKYPKTTYILELDDVLPYKDNISEKNLKGIREKFADVPVSVAKDPSTMFDWIKTQIP